MLARLVAAGRPGYAGPMPELPEVELAATRLREAALGGTIARAAALHPSLKRSLTPAACKRLIGRTIVDVQRRAKIQLITLDDAQLLEVHFRMTGDWEFSRDDDDAPRTDWPRFERVRISLTNGTHISLTDSRAFAVMRVHKPGAFVLPALGPEPLSDDFTPEVFARALATRRGPIKPALLDQKLVAGVGNIYAAEALWVAQIHPTRVASSLSAARVRALRDAIVHVLRTAPSGRYYALDDAGRTREDAWRVYGKAGEACARCGKRIRALTQAGRTTYYCGGCQR